MPRKNHPISLIFAAITATLLTSAAHCFCQLPASYVPIFQYNIFYNLNLEVDFPTAVPIRGAVFCNASIWSGTPNVTYGSTFQAVGAISTNRYDPSFVSNNAKSDTGTPRTNFYYPSLSGVTPALIPVGTNSSAVINGQRYTYYSPPESMINLPPHSSPLPKKSRITRPTRRIFLTPQV